MILITGKSALAYAISERLPNCIIVGRPEYDFSIQEDCNRLLIDFPNPDVVINTFCNFDNNWWGSSVINYVAPSYLTIKYYNQLTQGQIINISSASSWWPSYPGIPENRLYYGISKSNLSEFGRQFNRSIIDNTSNVIVTTVEPGRFNSPMSNHSGMEISRVVDIVEQAIVLRSTHISLIK